MSNHSTLERNTLDGFSEAAGILYLKLIDVYQGHERKAFMAACRFEERCAGVLDYILRNGPMALDAKTKAELSAFFSERWRHNFMDGG
ncbi:MAG: hypothetical protein V4657_11435 [Pseudomonadota bacterium]